jgi:hypothetical protein
MTGNIFCTQGWAPALRRGMLALVVGASLGAGLLGSHVSPASASEPKHHPHPTTEATGAPSTQSTGAQVSDQVGNALSPNSKQPSNSTPSTCQTSVVGSCGTATPNPDPGHDAPPVFGNTTQCTFSCGNSLCNGSSYPGNAGIVSCSTTCTFFGDPTCSSATNGTGTPPSSPPCNTSGGGLMICPGTQSSVVGQDTSTP